MLYIENNHEKIEVTEDIIKSLNDALELITTKEGVEYETSVDLTFVDDVEIRRINKESREIDKSTDVLSFPLLSYEDGKVFNECYSDENLTDDLFYEDYLMLGDVVISLDTAKAQANEFNHSFKREVVFLFTHSILHLLGYDHMNDLDKKKMNDKEDDYMNELGIGRD